MRKTNFNRDKRKTVIIVWCNYLIATNSYTKKFLQPFSFRYPFLYFDRYTLHPVDDASRVHSKFSSYSWVIVNMLIKKYTPPWHLPLLQTLLSYLIVSRLSGLGRKKQLTISRNYLDLPSGEIWHLNYTSIHESVSDLGGGVPVNIFASQIACKKTMV